MIFTKQHFKHNLTVTSLLSIQCKHDIRDETIENTTNITDNGHIIKKNSGVH